MTSQKVGRLVLALVLAGIAAYLAYAFVTMPYELVTIPAVTTTTVSTKLVPDGHGTAILALLFGVAAIIAAFAGIWD